MRLVNPFQPSPYMDWAAVSLDYHPLTGFKVPDVDGEYKRFLHRDLCGCVTGFLFTFACFSYPVMRIIGYTDWGWWMTLSTMALLLPVSVLDVVAHVRWEPTLKVARIRELCALGMLFGAMWCTTFPDSSGYVLCDRAKDQLALFVNRTIVPNFEKHCVKVVIVYPIASWNCGNNLISLQFGKYVIILWCFVAFFFLGYAVPSAYSAQVPRVHVAAALMYIGSAVISTMLAYAKERLRHVQFLQTVELTRVMRGASDRADEVNQLLSTMLPMPVLTRLLRGEVVSDYVPQATVFFSDMVQFTKWSSTRSARDVVAMLNVLVPRFDDWSMICGVEKVKTIGDAYWAFTGLTEHNTAHADIMCSFARGLLLRLEYANEAHPEWDNVRLRIGVHSGPLPGAILGTKQIAYEPYGVTNHIAEEVEKKGVANRVAVSSATRALLMRDATLPKSYDCLVFEDPITNTTSTFDLFLLGADDDDDDNGGPQPPTTKAPHNDDLDVKSASASSMVIVTGSNEVSSSSSGPGGAGSTATLSVTGSDVAARKMDRPSKQVDIDLQSEHERASSCHSAALSHLVGSGKSEATKFLATRTISSRDRALGRVNDLEDMEDQTSATLDAITERYSRNKYRCFFSTFVDDVIEAEYMVWARKRHEALRFKTRVAMAVGPVALLVAVLIEGAELPVVSGILFGVGIALSLGALALTSLDRLPLVDVSLVFLSVAATMVASALLPNSIVGNNLCYIHLNVQALIFLCTVELPWPVIYLVISIITGVPLFYTSWYSVYLFSDLAFYLMSTVMQVWLVRFFEKMLRVQFLDEHVTSYFTSQLERKEHEQRALLETIVPYRVITPLMKWMATGLNPQQSIVVEYPIACIGFMRLCRPPLPAAVDPALGMGGTDAAHGDDAAAYSWMLDAHAAVDRVLAQVSIIEKIKTVGDIVMFGGPFHADLPTGGTGAAAVIRPDADIRTAVDEALAVVTLCRETASVIAGMHIGDVVGAVVGTSRLAFDVFGDVVNVASRVMTTCPSVGCVAVSQPFHDAISEALAARSDVSISDAAAPVDSHSSSALSSGVQFSSPNPRHFKGKGEIVVYDVCRFPAVPSVKNAVAKRYPQLVTPLLASGDGLAMTAATHPEEEEATGRQLAEGTHGSNPLAS